MKIELDTTNLSTTDLAMLRVLDSDRTQGLELLNARIDELEAENRQLAEELKTARTPYAPTKKKGAMLESIKTLFTEHASLSLHEVATRIGNENANSVQNTLWRLTKEGYLDKSNTRPTQYFLKKNGNPELHDAIPRGTKISQLGPTVRA